MREILFRGKNVETGKWHYGLYIKRPNHVGIYPCIQEENLDTFLVDENTICQFTGLYDKNNIRIFEGNIIKYERNGKTIYGLVEFHRSAFSVEWFDEIYGRDFLGYLAGIEVIGNIFDNPELLKGEN